MRHLPRLAVVAALATALAPPAAGSAAAATTPFAFDQASPGHPGALAIDRDGTAFLATPETVGDAGVRAIRVAARRPDGTVVAVQRIAAPSGRAFFEPRIAVADHVATVAWTRQHDGGELRVQAVRCTVSGCGAVQTLGRAQRIKTRATPAVDAHGRSFVIWRGTSSKGLRLQWSISTSGHFGRAHTLGSGADDVAAAAEPDGTFAAAWSSRTGMYVAERRAEHEMGSAHRLSGGYPAADPGLVSAGRELLASWYAGGPDAEGEPGSGAVWTAHRSAGGHAFHSPQRVFAGHGRNVVLAANASGRAVVAFQDAGATPSAASTVPVDAAVREAGAMRFGAPAQLDDASPPSLTPAAAMSTAGTATVAWGRLAQAASSPGIRAAASPAGAGFGAPVALGTGQFPLAAASAQTLVVWNAGPSWLGVVG